MHDVGIHGDAAVTPWNLTTRYAAPAVLAVSDSARALPTAGGALVVIVGTDFGPPAQAFPPVAYYRILPSLLCFELVVSARVVALCRLARAHTRHSHTPMHTHFHLLTRTKLALPSARAHTHTSSTRVHPLTHTHARASKHAHPLTCTHAHRTGLRPLASHRRAAVRFVCRRRDQSPLVLLEPLSGDAQ